MVPGFPSTLDTFPRGLLRILFVLVLTSPLLLLVAFMGNWVWPSLEELGPVLYFTVLQAFLSAAVSVFLGLLAGIGLLRLKARPFFHWLEFLVLWPNLVPVLMVILAVLNLVTSWMQFPFGLPAIVGIHSLLNMGLVAVALGRILPSRLGAVGELAYLEGCSAFRFWRVTLWPYFGRDLILLFILVFSFCFTSFAIPLVVGGMWGTTLEVLIFQKLRSARSWGEALPLALLQVGAIFALAAVLAGRAKRPLVEVSPWSPVLGGWLSPRGLWALGLLPTAIVLSGLMTGLPQGLRQWRGTPEIHGQVLPLMLGTLGVGVAVGGLVFLLLLWLAFLWPHRGLQLFLRGYSAPSTAVTGFALLVWGSLSDSMVMTKIVVGLVLIYFPSLYRWLGESVLSPLYGQWQVAYLLGASPGLIFRRVVLPQVAGGFRLISGLAAFWALGDFALSSLLAPREMTLAMLVYGLMGAYRLELATLLVWPLLLLGAPFLLWNYRVFSRVG